MDVQSRLSIIPPQQVSSPSSAVEDFVYAWSLWEADSLQDMSHLLSQPGRWAMRPKQGGITGEYQGKWWLDSLSLSLSIYIYMYTYHMIQDDFSEPHYPITFRIYSLYYQCWIQVSEIWSFTQTELHEATTLIGMELRLEWKAIFVRYEEQAETS